MNKLEIGDRVRLTEQAKKAWSARGDGEHIREFGSCAGIVEGPMFPGSSAPEVDVRWESSHLRYGYHPDELEILCVCLADKSCSGAVKLCSVGEKRIGYLCEHHFIEVATDTIRLVQSR